MKAINFKRVLDIVNTNKKLAGAIFIGVMVMFSGYTLHADIKIEQAKAEMTIKDLENKLEENKEIIFYNNESVINKRKKNTISIKKDLLNKEEDQLEIYDNCIEKQLGRLATGETVNLEYCENIEESFTEEVTIETKKEVKRDIDAPIKNSDEYVIIEAMRFIKKHEGVRYTAYWDVKQYSICYGTKSVEGAKSNKEECEKLLKERVQSELLRINRLGDNLSSNKKIALISFFYNVGYKIDILNYARKGDDKSVIYLISLYNKAGGKYLQGLQNRRNAEIEIYKNKNFLTFAE